MVIMRTRNPKGYPTEPSVTHVPDDFKGSTVDSVRRPKSTLMAHIEGSNWEVDLYVAVLGMHETTKHYQPGLQAPYQQYKRIRGFVLKTTSPVTQSQDSDTKGFTLEGSANVFGVIKPNKGDIIVADIGDGQEHLLSITEVQRKTIYEESAYEITYNSIHRMTPEIQADLDEKVVEELYFDYNYLRQGINPIITERTLVVRRSLRALYKSLREMYIKDFYSRADATFVVPNQSSVTYDPHMLKFIKDTMEFEEFTDLNIRTLVVSVDAYAEPETVLTALSTLDEHMLARVIREMGLQSIGYFMTLPRYNSVAQSRVKQVVYPAETTNVDNDYHQKHAKPLGKLKPGKPRNKNWLQTVELSGSMGYENRTLFPSPTDTTYVFSPSLYQGDTANMTWLEQLVHNALIHKQMDLDVLQLLAQRVSTLDDVSRYYYIPIVLLLIKIHHRGY